MTDDYRNRPRFGKRRKLAWIDEELETRGGPKAPSLNDAPSLTGNSSLNSSDNAHGPKAQNSGHTPGPWEYVQGDERNPYNAGIYGQSGRLIHLSAAMSDEDKANARLIASAPDLLAALKLVRDFDCKNTPALMGLPWFKEMHAAVFAAIAKAEGAQ